MTQSRVLEFDFQWELESTPRQLWPLVTDTDRLNRAIGFEPVKITKRYEPGRGVRVFTEGRKAGMAEVGEDHPYEWVEPRRMSILREYSEGPFRWMVSIVELKAQAGGRDDVVSPAAVGTELLEDPGGIAVGRGRRLAQEPRAGLSAYRRDHQEPGRARAGCRGGPV